MNGKQCPEAPTYCMQHGRSKRLQFQLSLQDIQRPVKNYSTVTRGQSKKFTASEATILGLVLELVYVQLQTIGVPANPSIPSPE